MITQKWLQSEIEHALAGPTTRENVYDLSALITVLGYLSANQKGEPTPALNEHAAQPESEEARKKREAIILTAHSADLDTTPTITQIYDALDAVEVTTPTERTQARDAKTWAQIIGQKHRGGVGCDEHHPTQPPQTITK